MTASGGRDRTMLDPENKQVNDLQILPPTVLVRTLEDARRVVAAARRLDRPVLLLTEPGAQAWHGPAYLIEMVRQAGATRAVIDCEEDAGTAMLALRVGWSELHLRGNPDTVARVAAMAAAGGGRLHPRLPAALDLATAPVDEPLEHWLRRGGPN